MAVSVITIYAFPDCFIELSYKAYMHMMEVGRPWFSNLLASINGYFRAIIYPQVHQFALLMLNENEANARLDLITLWELIMGPLFCSTWDILFVITTMDRRQCDVFDKLSVYQQQRSSTEDRVCLWLEVMQSDMKYDMDVYFWKHVLSIVKSDEPDDDDEDERMLKRNVAQKQQRIQKQATILNKQQQWRSSPTLLHELAIRNAKSKLIGCLRIILRCADFLQPVNITGTHKEVTSRSKNVVADLGTNDPISHVRSTGTLARADSVVHRNNQRTQLPAVSWLPSPVPARLRSKSKSPVNYQRRRRSRSYSPPPRRVRDYRSRSPVRSRHYSSYEYDRRSFRDTRDGSDRSRRRECGRSNDRHSWRNRSLSPVGRKSRRDGSDSPKRRHESPTHRLKKSSRATSRSPVSHRGNRSSSRTDDQTKDKHRRHSRPGSLDDKHRSNDKIDDNMDEKSKRRDRRRSRSKSLTL
ncbi:Filamin/ABP280 repeat-containing protein (chloroplast) [Artemisia annua]|uniref:Filamin/ABP280 repeat-containing protein n=1 Tax=Artemisia annua TaxID=35608 RepID=A0A2U1QFU3_ARTAN|nr:Filamin/ABP280 repeat-containing protein [Artemisia annua]